MVMYDISRLYFCVVSNILQVFMSYQPEYNKKTLVLQTQTNDQSYITDMTIIVLFL